MSLVNLTCPCGSKKTYALCCEIAHNNIKKVVTAEQLMRSRYTAFTKAMGDYLMATHHSSTRPLSEKKDIVEWAKSVKWSHLEIIKTTNGKVKDTEGTVEFKAYFYESSNLKNIHEHSQFIKENNLWVYLGFVK